MRPAFWFGLTAGAALFAGLLLYQGAGEVLSAVALAGWGLLAVIAVHAGVLAADAKGLQALLGAEGGGSFFRLVRIWWIGNSVNNLLPVAQLGGEVVRARLLARGGTEGARAGAAVLVGLTAGLFSLLAFALSGVVLLGAMREEAPARVPGGLLPALAAMGCLFAAFYLAQRGGIILRLARWAERAAGGGAWPALTGGAASLDEAVASLYRDRRAFLACFAWRLAAWLVEAAEVWLALAFLGHPVSFATAFVLESLGQAIRSAGFAVPGALGVQEGGFLLLGLLLGVPGEVALGVSLVKRVRDLALGLPGLAAWNVIEGRSVLPRRGGGE